MNWKRIVSGVLAAAMLYALPMQLLASAEGAGTATANAWEELSIAASPDDCNTFFIAETTTPLKNSPTRKRTSKQQTASWIIWAAAPLPW